MRTGILVVFALAGAPVAFAQSQTSLGKFRSTLDHKVYELRQRGDNGLDIYAADGSLAAVLDRKTPGEPFKGKTQMLATRCPEQSGKIETVSNVGDRIRARVEVPSVNVQKRPVCNVPLISSWQPFDLVMEKPGERTVAATTGAVAVQGSNTFQGNDLQLQLLEVTADGPTLTVAIELKNVGADRSFITASACTRIQLVDGTGNIYQPKVVQVGNQQPPADLVNGVPTRLTLRFDDMPTRAGTMEATVVSRLTVPFLIGTKAYGSCPGKILAQFTNLAIQRR